MTKILIFTVMLSLVLSVTIIPSQQASALEVRTDFYDRHTTASHGDSRICGDHFCAAGEKPKWMQAIWGSQHPNSKKIPIAQHGEDIMSQLAAASSRVLTNKTNDNLK